MKTIKYFNEKLDKADTEFISDMIRDHLGDIGVSPCSFAMKFTLPTRRMKMKLTKEEALWLADKFYDIYYALNVDEMYEKDQKIFRSIERKLSEIK